VAWQTDHRRAHSLYGQDMLQFVGEYSAHSSSAYDAALYLLTHGHRCPADLAMESLGWFDRAVIDVLDRKSVV